MDDLISRQAAIDALRDWYDGMIISSFRGIEKVIKALPSAQPVDNDINVSCKDAISRQNAIDMIMGQPPEAHYPSWYAEQIKALPSAEPEITHCYDCVHYTGKDHPWGVCKIHKGAVTNKNRLCQGIDYCSWAERREDEGNDI